MTLQDRFWGKVNLRNPDKCWEWTGGVDKDGYGRFHFSGTEAKAHRFSYETSIAPIRAGLQLDHLCRNRACVNPSHLEAVSCRENVLRGVGFAAVNAAKPHCPQGHAYDEANTIYKGSWRICRECGRASSARYRKGRAA